MDRGIRRHAMGVLTMCSLPFFATVPVLSRWSGFAARVALPLVGTANTLFCT